MRKTGLFTDSTTVMPKEFAAEHEFALMPVPIYAAGTEYRDGVDITPEEFISLLETSNERPSTAVPGLGEFVSYYEQLLQEYDNIVYPVPSYKLTGLFDAAIQAAEQVKGATIVAVDPPAGWEKESYALRSDDPHLEDRLVRVRQLAPPVIVVLDTGYASGASGLVAMAGLTRMVEGKAIDAIVQSMITAKRNSNIIFSLNTLEYIVDRVGQLRAFVGTLLKIKPVLTFKDGYLEDAARARGQVQAKRKMIELLKQRVGENRIDAYVLHSLAQEEAADLLQQVQSELNVRNSWVGGIGCSVSRYTGRGGLGIAFTELKDPSLPDKTRQA
jgi:fatty acid-binding protein DegV